MFQRAGDINNLLATLNQYWPHMTRIFVATDDSNTILQASKTLHDQYNITWSANAARFPGGNPMSQAGHHANNDGAVNGVLDDQSGLASSAVLMGGSDSGLTCTKGCSDHALGVMTCIETGFATDFDEC